MSYSQFTLERVKEEFDLTVEESLNLFKQIKPNPPSSLLQTLLEEYIPLATAINTEKARSELLIVPILTEVRRQINYQISIFSGTEFNVDRAKGLYGFCDFLIAASQEQFFIQAPVVTLVEAKNENIKGGLGQCIATMVAAQLFNQAHHQNIETVYGAVTTGTNWRFLTLQDKTIYIDKIEYYISQVDNLLGILMHPFSSCLNNLQN